MEQKAFLIELTLPQNPSYVPREAPISFRMRNGHQVLKMVFSLHKIKVEPFLPSLNLGQTNEACSQRGAIQRTPEPQKHLRLSDPSGVNV